MSPGFFLLALEAWPYATLHCYVCMVGWMDGWMCGGRGWVLACMGMITSINGMEHRTPPEPEADETHGTEPSESEGEGVGT